MKNLLKNTIYALVILGSLAGTKTSAFLTLEQVNLSNELLMAYTIKNLQQEK